LNDTKLKGTGYNKFNIKNGTRSYELILQCEQLPSKSSDERKRKL